MGKKLTYALIILAFILFVGLIIYLRTTLLPGKSDIVSISEIPTPTIMLEKGKMSLKLSQTSPEPLTLGKPVIIAVVAESADEPIVGFDAVVEYDPQTMLFASVESTLPEFQILEQKNVDNVTLIGLKKLSASAPVTLQNSTIAELTFTPKKAGTHTFSLAFTPGSSADSNLMTEETDTKDILGSVAQLTVSVTE